MKLTGFFHDAPIDEAFRKHKTSSQGLRAEEVRLRLLKYGKNTLKEEKINKLRILIRQFKNKLIFILFAASLISIAIGEFTDFLIINLIIAINGLIGFWQELRAENSIAALKKLTETRSKVMRDGALFFIPSSELVPGDYIVLHEGEVVCADIRLTESAGLMADEASITGESLPALKDHSFMAKEEDQPSECKNMLFAGTAVVRGTGRGIVVKTGSGTYLASIAEKAQEQSPETPLTRSLNFFAKRYVTLLIGFFSFLIVFGFFQGRSIIELAYIILACLVSAVPEGLPIVITLVMIVGALALSQRKALVRYLPSVETLGSSTVIASDKTGTITEGKLIVKEAYAKDLKKLKIIAALCNDSHEGSGDPLDIALTDWADRDELKKRYPRQWAYSFDARLMLMATVHEFEGEKELLVKGAYESLKEMAQDKEGLTDIEAAHEQFLSQGLRVLAFGSGKWQGEDPHHWRIQIDGIVGFLDPPKEGVKEAVIIAKKAGVRVMMITGDHPATAKAVAKEVSIWEEGDLQLTGKELEKLSDDQLLKALKKTTVIARMVPEQKYRIVKLLQRDKEIVAVTGDGINDIPALKTADIGIAMGSGAEAAKSAAKMIIADNNLKTIVEAVKNARVIVDNIRKVIYYLVSTSLQEICFLSFAIFSSLPVPLFAIQILWINLVTDGVQDKTFPFARAEGDVMKRRPRRIEAKFLDIEQLFRIIFYGLAVGLFCFYIYLLLLNDYTFKTVSTIVFTCLVTAQWANGIQAQKEKEPFFKKIRLSLSINPFIFLGLSAGVALQLFAIYIVPEWFHCERISLSLWKYPLFSFLTAFSVVEIRKWAEFLFSKRKAIDK